MLCQYMGCSSVDDKIKKKPGSIKKFKKLSTETWNEITVLCSILQPLELWYFDLGVYDKKGANK